MRPEYSAVGAAIHTDQVSEHSEHWNWENGIGNNKCVHWVRRFEEYSTRSKMGFGFVMVEAHRSQLYECKIAWPNTSVREVGALWAWLRNSMGFPLHFNVYLVFRLTQMPSWTSTCRISNLKHLSNQWPPESHPAFPLPFPYSVAERSEFVAQGVKLGRREALSEAFFRYSIDLCSVSNQALQSLQFLRLSVANFSFFVIDISF
jgi:hypothetical protein